MSLGAEIEIDWRVAKGPKRIGSPTAYDRLPEESSGEHWGQSPTHVAPGLWLNAPSQNGSPNVQVKICNVCTSVARKSIRQRVEARTAVHVAHSQNITKHGFLG